MLELEECGQESCELDMLEEETLQLEAQVHNALAGACVST